jgi:hypothetical protein
MRQDTYSESQKPDGRRKCALTQREPLDLTKILRQLREDLDAANVRLLALEHRQVGRPTVATERRRCLLLVVRSAGPVESAPGKEIAINANTLSQHSGLTRIG